MTSAGCDLLDCMVGKICYYLFAESEYCLIYRILFLRRNKNYFMVNIFVVRAENSFADFKSRCDSSHHKSSLNFIFCNVGSGPVGVVCQRTGGALQITVLSVQNTTAGYALSRVGGAICRTGGYLQRTGGVKHMNCGAAERTCGAMQRTESCELDMTGGISGRNCDAL